MTFEELEHILNDNKSDAFYEIKTHFVNMEEDNMHLKGDNMYLKDRNVYLRDKITRITEIINEI